jgi:phosphopantothenoylcysteine decarboxylase/phosphopantothenate--cysteine ligase
LHRWLGRGVADVLAGRIVVVGITGGVAAHYLPELIGQLRFRHMAIVHAAMTPAAEHFVSPLTVATACEAPVWRSVFDTAERAPLAHIHWARQADLVLVAPATFDFIGKVASGLADDPVSLLLAATTAPVLLAPAMHATMWANPILQRNVATLEGIGYRIVPPETGLQATGEVGEGRMAGIGTILSALSEMSKTLPDKQKG